MSSATPGRGTARLRSGAGGKILAVLLILYMVGQLRPTTVSAQGSTTALDCSINGLCTSGSLTTLLGLPNGTLNIRTYHPWDQVVKTAPAWAPLEVEARATLAALHGVPNDERLPYAALSELRATIFMRLISLAQKRARGEALSGVEQDALNLYGQLIVQQRVAAAQKAVDEYTRWHNDPCHYTVPPNFGFDQYDPGPQCAVGGVMLAGPPRPPTANQFTAYGAALSQQDFLSADGQATMRNTDEALAIGAGVAGAIVVGGAATLAATLSTAVASTFAAVAGSFSIFGTSASVVAVGSTVSAGVVGVGVAASLPAIVIVSVVVGVIYAIQVFEDASVLPTLQDALSSAHQTPNIAAMAADPAGLVTLFSTFLAQTLPSYDAERAATVVPAVPTQHALGDPQFDVNGVAQDVLETRDGTTKLQQTFMAQGWFVTRTETSPGTWGPWEWHLTLNYRGANLSETGIHTLGIQPDGFFDMYRSSPNATPSPATRVAQIQALSGSLQTETVKWRGNHAPRLAPSVSDTPTIGTAVTFRAGASDPDGDTITAVRWFFEDPTQASLFPQQNSFAECSLSPPHAINPVSTLPYVCPWVQADDSGSGVTHTYARPGTFGVLVMARDSKGAERREEFTVTIGNLAPTLTVAALATPSVSEGEPVTITGTVNYPALPNGAYGSLTKLVVDWGDSQLTEQMYPCNAPLQAIPSDRHCLFVFSGILITYAPNPTEPPLAPGPWAFSFSHSYAYSPDHPLSASNPIKVYAVSDLGGQSQTEYRNVTVANTPPVFEAAPVCARVASSDPNYIPLPCYGDYREVPGNAPLTIRGRIFDAPGASHFVRVTWGDGTSSAYPAGCTDDGCPGHALAWVGASATVGNPPEYLSLSHTYDGVSTYQITITVDDGGPNGRVSYLTQAITFGASNLTGPDAVNAGASATWTYSVNGLTGFTPTVTPTCGGGTLTASTSSSFTCTFADVAAATPAQVGVHVSLAGASMDRTLPISILPRPLTLSALTGPGSAPITGGTSATFTYSATASPFATVTYVPSCDTFGTITASTPGFSFTCHFNDVPQTVPSSVRLDAHDSNGSVASAVLPITLVSDTTPPLLTLPTAVLADSTTNAGALVSFAASANDAVSGQAAVACSPQSGAQFPIGSTLVSCSASDWKGNTATGSFTVVVADVTQPTLSVPESFAVDATGPHGTVVTYETSAVDVNPAKPAVTCRRASGSRFPIGRTVVECYAADAERNTETGRFTVTVRGAREQIHALERDVRELPTQLGVRESLLQALAEAESKLAFNRSGACGDLARALSIVKGRRTGLAPDQVSRIVSDLVRIRAVLGC